MLEETSLKVDALDVLGMYEMELEHNGEKVPHRFTVYNTEILSSEVKLSHEHTDFQWATKDRILKLKIEPYLRLFLKEQK